MPPPPSPSQGSIVSPGQTIKTLINKERSLLASGTERRNKMLQRKISEICLDAVENNGIGIIAEGIDECPDCHNTHFDVETECGFYRISVSEVIDPLEAIRRFAEEQMDRQDEDGLVGFEHNGQFIVNPWIDPSARFALTTEDAISTYGKSNILHFLEAAYEKLYGEEDDIRTDSASSPSIVATITKWGEDDYSVEYLELPADISNTISQLVEDHCGCSVRGNAASIICDIKDLINLKQD